MVSNAQTFFQFLFALSSSDSFPFSLFVCHSSFPYFTLRIAIVIFQCLKGRTNFLSMNVSIEWQNMQIEERTAEKKQYLQTFGDFLEEKRPSFPNVLHNFIKISLAYYRSYFARLTSSSKLRKRKIFPISKILSTIELNNLLHTILTFI